VWDLQQKLWIKTPEQAERDRVVEELRKEQYEADMRKAIEEDEKAFQRVA
jgi:hypothetical protein